jgi:hypothetical protein
MMMTHVTLISWGRINNVDSSRLGAWQGLQSSNFGLQFIPKLDI